MHEWKYHLFLLSYFCLYICSLVLILKTLTHDIIIMHVLCESNMIYCLFCLLHLHPLVVKQTFLKIFYEWLYLRKSNRTEIVNHGNRHWARGKTEQLLGLSPFYTESLLSSFMQITPITYNTNLKQYVIEVQD